MAAYNTVARWLWCCGNLNSAAITVGVSDIVVLLLVTGHFIESELTRDFGLHVVAFCLVVLFLFASTLLLLHGIVKKHNWLLLPWMILHLAAILGTIIFSCVQYGQLQNHRAILFLGSGIQIYFLILVFLHYLEMRASPKADAQDTPDLGEQRKNDCLIDLEMEEKPDNSNLDDSLDPSTPSPFAAKDDTFTQLATTRSAAPLPTPDEVISLSSANCNPDVSSSNSVIPRRTTPWSKSSATLDGGGGSGGCGDSSNGGIGQQQPLLSAAGAKSDSRIAHVDNNFSPFRSKNAAQNGPKMKVFLPNKSASDDEDDDDEDDDNTSDEEQQAALANKSSNLSNNHF